MIDKELYNKVLKELSKETNLPMKVVDKVYKTYWKVIKQHIVQLPLKEDLTDEEFQQLQPNVNIPSLGKLYVTLDRYRAFKYMYNKYNKKRDATH